MDRVMELSVLEILGLEWTSVFFRYAIMSALTYYIFWKWAYPKFASRFLYKVTPTKKDINREFFYSFLSTIIFLLPTIVAVVAFKSGVGNIYIDISDYSWTWYIATYVIMFFVHDAYFYWTHRLMHHPKLYKKFHKVHHLSKNPTPFAAYSFHPLEALVEASFFTIFGLLLPVHVSVMVIFNFFSLFMNIYAHLGFNIFSEKQLNEFPLKVLSHPGHHGWHHQNYKGNYGFYLKFWDKVMGTFKGELMAK